MIATVSVFLVLVGVSIADQSNFYQPPEHEPVYKEEGRPYEFEYGVKDEYRGTDFSHTEESDGEVVRGSYTVQLPDGRKQTVTYVADHEGGYQAEVTYYGEAQYPHEYGPPVTFKPQAYEPEPSYKPQPTYQPKPSYQPAPVYQPRPSYS